MRKALANPDFGNGNPSWLRLFKKDVLAYREFLRTWEEYGTFAVEDIVCVLDKFQGNLVQGWAIDQNDPNEPLRMDAYVDGEKIEEVI